MREMTAVDWHILKDEQRIRRWPSAIGEKREIRVTITTWKGVSIGAKHWTVHVEEQDNAWWCEDENAWVTIQCDSERRGYSLRAEVLSKQEAVKLATDFVTMIAGARRLKHDVVWMGDGRPKWAH